MPSFVVNLSLPLRKLVWGECCGANCHPFPYPLHALPPTSAREALSQNSNTSRKSLEVQELLIPSQCFVLEIFKHTGTLKDIDDEPTTPTTQHLPLILYCIK